MRQGGHQHWQEAPQYPGGFAGHGFDDRGGGMPHGGMPPGMPGMAPGMMFMPGAMPGTMPAAPGMGMMGMMPAPGMMSPMTHFPPPPQQQLPDNNRQRKQRPTGPDGQPLPRNNEIGDPSPVIHLRNVTPEVSQLSIQNLVQSFGRVKSIVMLRQKNQALVEMDNVESAKQIVEYFKDPGYSEIDGRRVYVRYSVHTELTAMQRTSKTLLVSMFNTQYDVSAAAQITPMIVYQIFSNYGTIEKIVVLPKNDSSAQNYNRVQALVQFETVEIAEEVKNMLQGQPVTLGETVTFTLDIQFSRMDEIKTSSPHNSLVVPKGGSPQPPPPSQPAGKEGMWDGHQ